MPEKLLKEFINKEAVITLINDNLEFTGLVEEVEAYWIKIKEGSFKRVINGAMIRDIRLINKKD